MPVSGRRRSIVADVATVATVATVAAATLATARDRAVVVRRRGARSALATARDLREMDLLLPAEPAEAAQFSVAVMDLGALVCTARAPRCAACPVADPCAWRAAGFPLYDGPPRRTQAYAGTDRQVRGRLM